MGVIKSCDLDAIGRRIPPNYAGPWYVAIGEDTGHWYVGYRTGNPSVGLIATVPDYGEDLAEFIAHSREDIPDLLAEVERLRARVAELTTDRDAWRADRNKLARAIQGVRAVADRCASGEWPECTGPVTGAMLAELLAALEKIAGGAS